MEQENKEKFWSEWYQESYKFNLLLTSCSTWGLPKTSGNLTIKKAYYRNS
jgi:hypothetical protein